MRLTERKIVFLVNITWIGGNDVCCEMFCDDVPNDSVELLDAPFVSEDDPVLSCQRGQDQQVCEKRFDVALEILC